MVPEGGLRGFPLDTHTNVLGSERAQVGFLDPFPCSVQAAFAGGVIKTLGRCALSLPQTCRIDERGFNLEKV